MAQLSQGDRYLLNQIASGDKDGWGQLVEKYQGRLLAFARGKLSRKEEAEDLVQDTFIAFLEGIKKFRENASIETYLFTILRHKLIDFFRGKHVRTSFLQESFEGQDDGRPSRQFEDSAPTASWYARRDEQASMLRSSLADALDGLVERFKESENLRDLQVIEALFYAQLRNKDAAVALGLDEKQIALIKHRALGEIRANLLRASNVNQSEAPLLDTPAWESAASTSSLLTEVWEEQRPTCPKRSTIGRHLLGTLQDPWKQYVQFHIEKLGCHFCRANFDDLKKQTTEEPRVLHTRVMQSTIGFFRQA